MADPANLHWEALRRAYAPPTEKPHDRRDKGTDRADNVQSAMDDAARLDRAEERAAIMQYDAGLPRTEAEAIAYIASGLPLPGTGGW